MNPLPLLPDKLNAVIVKSTGSWYTLRLPDGSKIVARLKGKFRLKDLKTSNPLAVGDFVNYELEPGQDSAMITEILDRRNYIIRTDPHKKAFRQIIAANLDQVVLITSLKQPRVPLGFIDRFTVIAEAYHIPVVVVFNKADLYEEPELEKFAEARSIYQSLGYKVLFTSVLEKKGLQQFDQVVKNKTSLFSGHSGVGKSALINYLAPDLDLKTNNVSDYNEKGQHTTTFAEMHDLKDERFNDPNTNRTSFIIDSPGVKEFGIMDIELTEVSQYFPEMRPLITACRFNNCLHLNEPDCAVKDALEQGLIHPLRFNSYLGILEELQTGLKFWEKK